MLLHATGIDPEQAARSRAGVAGHTAAPSNAIPVAGANEFAKILKRRSPPARSKKILLGAVVRAVSIDAAAKCVEDARSTMRVTFELSPPSWEALPESSANTAEVEPEALPRPEAEVFDRRRAARAAPTTNCAIRALFADACAQVQITMTATAQRRFRDRRLAFINTLIGLNQKGKQSPSAARTRWCMALSTSWA